jgi:hypothetical protein
MNDDILTDEEIITRESALMRSTAPAGRKLGDLTIRPMTSETLTYLWHTKNFFMSGMMGGPQATNANPVWSTAEFVYIHAGDMDEVAEVIWDSGAFKARVRDFLRGPLNDPQMLNEALPIIEEMVREYFAAQNESAASKHAQPAAPGKKPARAGKRSMSQS